MSSFGGILVYVGSGLEGFTVRTLLTKSDHTHCVTNTTSSSSNNHNRFKLILLTERNKTQYSQLFSKENGRLSLLSLIKFGQHPCVSCLILMGKGFRLRPGFVCQIVSKFHH